MAMVIDQGTSAVGQFLPPPAAKPQVCRRSRGVAAMLDERTGARLCVPPAVAIVAVVLVALAIANLVLVLVDLA